MENLKKLIEVNNLCKYFNSGSSLFSKDKGILKAVDGVSLSINKGETVGIVGESGCGKSTLGRTILRLYKKTSGNIYYEGHDIGDLKEKDLKLYRKNMQMIFQDPYASLNPRFTVEQIIKEPLEIHNLYNEKEKRERVRDLLNKVGMNENLMNRYPHEFSGGQRQRIGIARALAVEPKFIVCDEPISALDVSIQAQIVNMLQNLQETLNLTYLFIAHDLSMVKHISDRIGIMYLGKLVEISESEEVYKNPLHPYTKALLSAIPIPDPNKSKKKQRIILQGDIPSPIDPPKGCRFKGRCKYCKDICGQEEPCLKDVGGGHLVACHLFD